METVNLEENYSTKIQALFELGREPLMRKHSDKTYEKFGFTDDDIDELIELATDNSYKEMDYEEYEEESDRFFYATIHAIYLLGTLKATKAIDPLLEQMENEDGKNDFFNSAIVDFFILIGDESISHLEEYMFLVPDYPEVINTIEVFSKFLNNDLKLLNRIEPILVRYIQNNITYEATLAFAICTLIEHTNDKHIELIRQAFKTKEVENMWCGDLEDIEIKLGLRKERETDRVKNKFDELVEVIGRNIDKSESINISAPISREEPKVGRNDPCPCGSGKKYKKCCINK